MWFTVLMAADDWDYAIVYLNDTEYAAVRNFLNQVKQQRFKYSWAGGHWKLSKPCATKEEAEKIDLFQLLAEDEAE